MIISLLLGGFVLAGASTVTAQERITDGYVVDNSTVDTDGPTNITADLEAVNDSTLDSDPVNVTVDVLDQEGDVVGTQTTNLTSSETASLTFGVGRGTYDVEILVNSSSEASYLNSTSISSTEDRESNHEVANETVEVSSDTTTVYADLTSSENASSNTTVTVDIENANGTVVAYDTIEMEPNSTTSVEFNATELDLEPSNHTVRIYTESSSDGDLIRVDDIGTLEDTSNGTPLLGTASEKTGLTEEGIIAVVLLLGVAIVAYRR